jgi:hypothetical protein
MTLHLPRLPISLDPLLGEAKRRMRKRRALVGVAAVFLVGAVTAVALALGSSGGGTPSSFASVGSVSVGRLTLPVPRGFNQYRLRACCFYKAGTRPPVVGHVLTDYRVSAQSEIRRGGNVPQSEPANGVALQLQLWIVGGGPPSGPPTRLHLPLSLDEPWLQQGLPGGTLFVGWLSRGHRGQPPYELALWIGRDASPADRAALLHALAAIHRTH